MLIDRRDVGCQLCDAQQKKENREARVDRAKVGNVAAHREAAEPFEEPRADP